MIVGAQGGRAGSQLWEVALLAFGPLCGCVGSGTPHRDPWAVRVAGRVCPRARRWGVFFQGKVFPKLRKRSPQGSSESTSSDKEDDEATDYVFRIIYPGMQSELGKLPWPLARGINLFSWS